ncbi:hypothetical protein [Paenibacillus chungangensis]|uniref:ABC transporter domain-containing protein n=1 Tax=Paenibacillus chungangensis TaxID=696535 RepID=A0ABW3HNJ1_9BACL
MKQFGLADMQKKRVDELSGGQKQRLFIVLALSRACSFRIGVCSFNCNLSHLNSTE